MAGAEIVITGLGIVSPLGVGTDPYWSALLEGRSGIRPLQMFDASALPAPFGGEVVDFDAKSFVQPRKALKVMSREIQLAYVAAKLATQQAALEPGSYDPERIGVVFGADLVYCEIDELTPTYKACIEDGKYITPRWGTMSLRELNPLWMLKYLPNMPACHIAIAHDARGPNNSLTVREVSTLLAIAEAMRVIERGAADIMIVGGTGAPIHPTPLVYRQGIFLSKRKDTPESAARPFDATRDGMVNGEGSATFVLERREHAEKRGVKALARLASYACSAEAVKRGDLIRGDSIRRVLRGAISAAGLNPNEIGHVGAMGFGTVEHDIVEASAIHDVVGDVPVTAPSSHFGNLAAGSGAVELAASVLALHHGVIPPTLNYSQPDPACPVNVVHGAPQKPAYNTALKVSYTVGGQAAALVLAGV